MSGDDRKGEKRRSGRPKAPDDVHGANAERGRMGFGHVGGGYGRQHFDVDRTGGAYGGNESAGGGYVDQQTNPSADQDEAGGGRDPLARDEVRRGMQHMSGTHGQAYGRTEGVAGHRLPADPSQRPARSDPPGQGARPGQTDPNAQIAGGGLSSLDRGQESERDAPGIATNRNSRDGMD